MFVVKDAKTFSIPRPSSHLLIVRERDKTVAEAVHVNVGVAKRGDKIEEIAPAPSYNSPKTLQKSSNHITSTPFADDMKKTYHNKTKNNDSARARTGDRLCVRQK